MTVGRYARGVDLEPGEQVFFHGHPCWRSMLGFYLKGLLAAVVAGAIAGIVTRVSSGHVSVGWVIVVVLVAFLLMFGLGALRMIQTTYTITDRRLTIESGLLSRELHETNLARVQNVNSRQSLLERILAIGTVDFDTAGGADYDFRFRGVAAPGQIARTVSRAMHQGRELRI